MAGPTTESLDVDVKGIREDLRRVEVSLFEKITSAKEGLANRIGALEVVVGKQSARLNMAMGILGFLSTASLGVGMKSLADGAYYAGSLNTSVKDLGIRVDKLQTRMDRLESMIEERSRATDAQLEKIQASIAKILEQTRPSAKPQGLSVGPEIRPVRSLEEPMTREVLLSVLEITPFRPMTVHLSSGSSYLVPRRESAWLAPEGDTVVISTGSEGYAMLAIDQITSLQIGPPPASEV